MKNPAAPPPALDAAADEHPGGVTRRLALRSLSAAGASAGLLLPLRAHARQTLHLSHIYNLEDLRHKALSDMADEVRRQTQGEVDITIHPLSQMAGLRDGVEGVRLGTIDMTMADTATLSVWAPALGLWSLPFVFNDHGHMQRAAAGALGAWRTREIRARAGLVALGQSAVGLRVMLTTKRAIHTAADLRGVKMRVPEIPMYVATFRALGANATPVPWGEVYAALQAGVVEGVESNPSSFILAKHVEVAKHVSRTHHILLDAGLLMNPARFDGLSRDAQTVLVGAARRMHESLSAAQADFESKAWVDLARWVKPDPAPDLPSFRKAVAPLVEDFARKTSTGELVAQLAALQ